MTGPRVMPLVLCGLLDSTNGTVSVQAQGMGMTRAGCTILVGVFTIWYLDPLTGSSAGGSLL